MIVGNSSLKYLPIFSRGNMLKFKSKFLNIQVASCEIIEIIWLDVLNCSDLPWAVDFLQDWIWVPKISTIIPLYFISELKIDGLFEKSHHIWFENCEKVQWRIIETFLIYFRVKGLGYWSFELSSWWEYWVLTWCVGKKMEKQSGKFDRG